MELGRMEAEVADGIHISVDVEDSEAVDVVSLWLGIEKLRNGYLQAGTLASAAELQAIIIVMARNKCIDKN